MSIRYSKKTPAIPRRRFLGLSAAVGACGMAGCRLFCSRQARKRNVLLCSDIHVGYIDGGMDGEYWYRKAMEDIAASHSVDYALALGDMVHYGTETEYLSYLSARDESGIGEWYEIAGNHEYYNGGIVFYNQHISNKLSYAVKDGNILWIMLSDEADSTRGEISRDTFNWLLELISNYGKDNNIFVCTHQLVWNTVHNPQNRNDRYLYVNDQIAEHFGSLPVDLWLCGHEHGVPWQRNSVFFNGRTTFVNIASLSHAYNTGESHSFILKVEEGGETVAAVRRLHDSEQNDPDPVAVPVSFPVRLGEKRETFFLLD